MKITCSGCQAVLKVDDSLAGRRGKCPKCGVIFDIPKAGAITKPVDPPATERQKNYATSLGLDFPPEITREEMCKLLDKAGQQKMDTRPERPVAVAERPAGIMDPPAASTKMPAETADKPVAPTPSFDLEGEDEDEDDLQLPADTPPLPPEPSLPVEMDSAAQPSATDPAAQASPPPTPRPSVTTPAQILAQLARRGLGSILITFPMEGDLQGFEGINFAVSFSQNLSEQQVRQALVSMANLLTGPSA